jgi:ABC-2 type transport system permease protein
MAMFGGLFYPLPHALETIRPVWPTYHLQQLGLAATGQPSFGSAPMHVAVLVAVTVVSAALAARRLARAG